MPGTVHIIFWGKVVAVVVAGSLGYVTVHKVKGSIEAIRVNFVDSKNMGTCT